MVSINANEYRIIQETVLELSIQETDNNMLIFDGTSKVKAWKELDTNWFDHPSYNDLNKPDIAGFGATSLALCKSLLSHFGESFKGSCELLPINMAGSTWYILNVLTKSIAVNETLSVRNMRNGRPSRTRLFKNLVLDSNKIDSAGLFHVEGVGLATFCTDESGGFYDTVQKYNLKGLIFTEVEVS